MSSYKTVFFITSGMCMVSGLLVLINVKEPQKQISKSFSVIENYKYVFSLPEIHDCIDFNNISSDISYHCAACVCFVLLNPLPRAVNISLH
ncbi:MAG: hypothetical protein R3A12_05000 [Ignavibacteria bacterium]